MTEHWPASLAVTGRSQDKPRPVYTKGYEREAMSVQFSHYLAACAMANPAAAQGTAIGTTLGQDTASVSHNSPFG